MNTITLVCGFGRCGSSLVMQMLEAGGMPCTGQYPAFEDEHCGSHFLTDRSLDADWLASIPGHAVKLLDPHRGAIPPGDYRVIWCSRDFEEQARSQVKFLRMLCGVQAGRREEKAFRQSYLEDKLQSVKALIRAAPGRSILEMRFEKVLANPFAAADQLNNFCGGHLEAEAMAAVVRPRSPLCASGVDMELRLIAEREARAA